MQSTYIAYQELANAVVLQAVEDYRNALDGRSYTGRRTPEEIVIKLEKFFRSDYYRTLTKVNGEYLIEKLKQEHKEKQKEELL